MTRLPALLCLVAILCMQVPWLFCLDEGHGDGAPLVVSAETACEHHHDAFHGHAATTHAHSHAVERDHESDSHDHEHLILLGVGTCMPQAVALDAPAANHDLEAAPVLLSFVHASTRAADLGVGAAPPEVTLHPEVTRSTSARLLL